MERFSVEDLGEGGGVSQQFPAPLSIHKANTNTARVREEKKKHAPKAQIYVITVKRPEHVKETSPVYDESRLPLSFYLRHKKRAGGPINVTRL